MKKILRNRKGMTLAELLVAFSLLVLIVFVFTPMLLQSYDTIYKAGEREQEALAGKTSLEEQLAIREETNLKSLKMNFTNFTDKINIIGRKVVYDVTSSSILETLFHGARASVRIISPSTVYDDTETQKVIIQTKNISFGAIQKTKTDGSAMTEETRRSYVVANNTNPTLWTNPGNKYDHRYSQISICAYAPDKPNAKGDGASTVLEENVYQNLPLNVQITNVYQDGRIALTISSTTSAKINFTNSPVKIVVYYYDEDGGSGAQGTTPYSVSDYLYIQPMTLLLGGKSSSSVDYVTSAGMVTESLGLNNEGDERIRTSLTTEGREIPVDNSKAASSYDLSTKGVEIQNISWIDNDDTDYYDNYYVMTGTNGTIMRMYVFNSNVGIGAGVKSDVAKYNGAIGTTDKTYRISSGTEVYPALWSGDKSHQFAYSIYKTSSNYGGTPIKYSTDYGTGDRGGDKSWLTESSTKGKGQDGVFGLQAKYSMFYNGTCLDFTYISQEFRRIGYVITEWGYPFNLAGNKGDKEAFTGYQIMWEDPIHAHAGSHNAYNTYPQEVHYFQGNGGYSNQHIASPMLIAYSSNSIQKIKDTTNNKSITQQNDIGNASSYSGLTVTDSVYIPNGSSGSILYLGTKSAYAVLQQNDNNFDSTNGYAGLLGKGTKPEGNARIYFVEGSSSGSEIYKVDMVGSNGTDRNRETIMKNTVLTSDGNTRGTGGVITNQSESNNFFIECDSSKNTISSPQKANFANLNFTFGYSSNREFIYSNITYNGSTEAAKSYEKYYFLSHYGTETPSKLHYTTITQNNTAADATYQPIWWHNGKFGVNFDYEGLDYCNSYNNDYYNMWMPGEFYNLTKTATKEGVTVAVGYAVSGSTYQYINPAAVLNTSTAIGSVYNDGVLAVCCANKDGTNPSMKNILYFKDNATIDKTSLTSAGGITGVNADIYKNIYNDGGTAYYIANSKNSPMWYAGWRNMQRSDGRGTKSDDLSHTDHKGENWLSRISNKNYGTHSRQSIQFTAVDLVVEENNGTVPKDADGNYTGGDVTNSKDYVAFYGDNTGRVFRSKVASASVTGKYELKNGEYVFVPKGSYDAAGNFIPDPASDLAPVPFVKDLTYAGSANSSAGQMEEIVLSNGNKAKDYFTKIVTITASNDLVVISGESASNTCYVIIGTRYNKNAANESAVPEYEWNWRAVPLSKGSDAVTGKVITVEDDDGNKVQQTVLDSANTGTTMVGYKIKDAVMVNGYYYAVGSQDSSNSFILAADLDSLKYDPGKTSTDNNKTIVTYYHTIEGFTVNCIGGHNTQ